MSTSLGSEGGGGGGWDDGTGAAEGQFPDDEAPFKRSRKRTKQGVYTSDITLDDLAAHFHQPASKACQELGMGLTIFKRVCRKLGLQRWPYEKPCKAEGERTSGAARAGGTPRGTGSWHLPPVTQAWAGGARAGNHAAAPGGSRASSGQASGQELVAAAAQIEGALQQQDKRVRTAAIQHLAEILVKDSDAAEELLAAIGTAVQQQQQQQQQQPAAPSLIQPGEGQQHQQPQQEQAGEAGRVQQLPHPSRPQALLAPPPLQARPHQQQVQLQQRGPQFPTLQPLPQPAQQQGTVEQLLAALQDVQPPVSRPLGVLLQQPALPLNMAGQHPGPAQQPPPQPAMLPPGPQQAAPPQQQDDLAAVLDVLRSAFEAQTGAGPQMESGLSDVAQQAMPQSAAMPGEPDRITPLLQQLLSWGQPHSLPKQEQPTAISQTDAPRALASVAALHASELSVQQQQQPQQHQGRQGALSAVPAGSIGSPPKPQSSQQTLAMGLVVAAVQGQASSQSAQPPPPAGPQKRDAGLSAAELGLLAAIQQAGGGAAAQSTARQLVQVPARLPSAGDPSSPRQAPKPPAP